MRRLLIIGCVALLLAALLAPPAAAGTRVHSSFFVGVGPMWWPGTFWAPPYAYYPYYPPYYYDPYYPYRYVPAPLIVQEPPVYVQKPAPSPAPPDAPHWYYCPSARAYYPTVAECPEAWIKVPPRPE